MEPGTGFAVSAVLALIVFGIVLAICWLILPFALIGTKPLLRQLLAEQRETNRLLRAIGEDGRARPAPARAEPRL